MIAHLVFFKWKEGTEKNEIDRALSSLRQLKTKCLGIIDIKTGENFSSWSEGFTHGLMVLAKDRKALEEYRLHPAHTKLVKEIEKLQERTIAVDFEDYNETPKGKQAGIPAENC